MARHESMPDVSLTRSPLGGFTVEWKGKFIGWIHESNDRWNAYIRGTTECDQGVYLGRHHKDEAIRRILTEAGWPDQLKRYLAERPR